MNNPHPHQISLQQHYHQQKRSYQYLLSQPKKRDKHQALPLILFLHGRGEIGDDIHLLLDFGPNSYLKQHQLDAICVSPQVPKGRNGWAIAELISLLDELEQQHHIDRSRVYLTGLSMGGFGALNLALAQPQRFAALAVLAAGDPNRLAPWSMNMPARPVCAELYQRLAQLPIWLAHGLKDETIPADFSQELVDKLSQLERTASLQFTQYPQHGHNIWDELYNRPSFWQWLLEQENLHPNQTATVSGKFDALLGDYGNHQDYVSITQEPQGLSLVCKDLQDKTLQFSLHPVADKLFFCEIGCVRFIQQAEAPIQLALTRLTLLDKLPSSD
ncbi:alpha/beta hydrolase-fold protein [Agarivorans sp. QJM3NY_29]|uniref:carboxylesterase family protein n=1 Tax=unclassified Agarivorans TaxID=2636026 RepID=UPI003D7E345E